MVAQRKLGFAMLTDHGNALAAELGLRFTLPDDLKMVYQGFGLDLEASNGEPSWTLAMPARYIVDTAGVIRYARIHPDYTRRPEPAETLEALKAL